MRSIVILTFLFSILFCKSQDQVIERSTLEAADFELKILEMKNDTLYALSYGTIEKTPISNVLAYRKNYKKNTEFIYPDSADSKIYTVIYGKAIKKTELKYSTISPKAAQLALIQPYEMNEKYKAHKKKGRLYLLNLHDGDRLQIPKYRKISLRLSDDKLDRRISAKLYRADSTKLIVSIGRRSGRKLYAFKREDLKQIGIEPPVFVAMRSTLLVATAPVAPIFRITRIFLFKNWYLYKDMRNWALSKN